SSCAKAFLNAEICQRICSYAPPGDLSRLSRVSKAWEISANVVLWHELPSLDPLLDLVTPDMWAELVERCYKTAKKHKKICRAQNATASGPPAAPRRSQWSSLGRVRSRADLVCRVSVDLHCALEAVPAYTPVNGADTAACREGVPLPLLSSLKALTILPCSLDVACMGHLRKAWPRVFPANIDTIDVQPGPPAVIAILLSYHSRVRRLCIHSSLNLSQPLGVLASNARTIAFHDLELTAPYSKMGVEALSQAKDLKTITWLVMSSSAQDGLPVTQAGSFEALQSLDLAFKFPEFPAPKLSQAIIESFDHQRLRRLCLQHIGRITADEFYDLLVAISRSCNPHALQTLVIRRREGDLLSCVDWPLYLSHLVLLAEFKQLQMLVLDVARGVILDQRECQAVAKWWPRLRTLRLSSVSDKARRSPTPLACVAVFAEKCADLETLALAVDTRSIQWPWQRPEPGEPLPSQSWVTTLDVGDSTIDSYSVEAVVDFLARTLPCLRRILHSSVDEQQSLAWAEVTRRVLESTAPDDGDPGVRRLSAREPS
ncbi:hypothetical protein K523DRAFT_195377, partial [Schizophyllum commune Tattone D]